MPRSDVNQDMWLQRRAERIGGRWLKEETCCEFCGNEMWFTDFETIPEFIRRSKYRGDDVTSRVATLDHIIPLSSGGLHEHCNLTTMCKECNMEKGAQDPTEWMIEKIKAGTMTARQAKKLNKKILDTFKLARKMNRSISIAPPPQVIEKRKHKAPSHFARIDGDHKTGSVSLAKEPWD